MEPTQQTKSKILIVEDDLVLSKMYKTKFASEGFSVLTAEDGEEGLKVAIEQRPAVILLDIMMPKLSGMDLLRKLREDQVGKSIPVIILTNLAQKTDADEAAKLGVKEFLVKANLTPAQVVEKVRRAMTGGGN